MNKKTLFIFTLMLIIVIAVIVGYNNFKSNHLFTMEDKVISGDKKEGFLNYLNNVTMDADDRDSFIDFGIKSGIISEEEAKELKLKKHSNYKFSTEKIVVENEKIIKGIDYSLINYSIKNDDFNLDKFYVVINDKNDYSKINSYNDNIILYNSDYLLYKEEENEWKLLDKVLLDNSSIKDENGLKEFFVELNKEYGQLEKGKYRIKFTFNYEWCVYISFEIE